MPALDRSAAIDFGLYDLNRFSERRDDAAFIESHRRDSATDLLVFVGGAPLLNMRSGQGDALFSHDQVALMGTPAYEIFLGQAPDGAARFAAVFDKTQAPHIAGFPGLEIGNLRSIALCAQLSPDVLGTIGGANALVNWHQRHGFCAHCGAPTRITMAGWRRDCDACGAQHFPRVDPVVIMLTIDGDRCLLGRQPQFAPGMFSALAGFLEPGETIEHAVRREVLEESGVTCSHVAYFASQPWPFPSSLMVGCFARAASTALTVDKNELEDARWFTRQEVVDMLAGTHPGGLTAPKPYAIAHHLMRAFAEHGDAVLG